MRKTAVQIRNSGDSTGQMARSAPSRHAVFASGKVEQTAPHGEKEGPFCVVPDRQAAHRLIASQGNLSHGRTRS